MPRSYEAWYGHAHLEPEALAEAVYGLPELHRDEIAATNLVANPGCYPTSIILGLAPLARAGWLHGTVIADSKSGISGAGRSPSLKTHFVEANENMSPYSIGRTHRHLAEMDQELGLLVGHERQRRQRPWRCGRPAADCLFAPPPAGQPGHPLHRLRQPAGRRDRSAGARGIRRGVRVEPFVHLLKPGQVATLAHAVHTNFCAIGLTCVPDTNLLIVTAAIDNLIKGAAGQAVQNMNIMLGCDERLGLL